LGSADAGSVKEATTIGPPDPAVERPIRSRRKRRRLLAVLSAIIAVVAIAGAAAAWKQSDEKDRPPEVTFLAALQAMEEGKVSRVHMNDGTREATLVLTTGIEVVTVYPERSGPEVVETARRSDVRLTASRWIQHPWWIRYAYLPASLAMGLLLLGIIVAMDRRGVWHEKDTWLPGARVKKLEATVDRLEVAVDRIERRINNAGES
jgi:hypothetical protein